MTAPLTIDDRTIRARKFASQIIAIIQDCVSDRVGAESRLIDAAYQADIEIVRATGTVTQAESDCGDYVKIPRGPQDKVDEIVQPYRKQINATPELMSILYDIDMLPEQCVTIPGAIRLTVFCEMWKRMESASPAQSSWQPPEGFVLVPIEPTSMMALRGSQVTNVFEENDYFGDYIDAAELPKELAPQHRFDDDERPWMLAAAAYRGCIAGYMETLRRLAKDPKDVVAFGWNKPIRHRSQVTSTDRGASK